MQESIMTTNNISGCKNSKSKNFDKWYQEVLTKCDMIEYYDITGCYILKPETMSVWENIKSYMDQEFKKLGVKNMYFPLFVRKQNLEKEATHIAGFAPEVAWIKTGDKETQDSGDIAIRPTSETVIYPYAKKWIRSYKDLPIKMNQWCNIVRWELSAPTPFVRAREFLWQEGHTFHQTKAGADQEVMDILKIYQDIYQNVLLVPVIPGIKTESEKFCGADYTTTLETFIPECGRAIQSATSHCLGQNFSKMFDITYTDDKNSENNYVWQNSWGFSTRSIGVMVMTHCDDKGLVLPPKVASIQIVIVTKEDNIKNEDKEGFETYLNFIKEILQKFRVETDRSDKTIGQKFNEWEMKGIPIRIEIGEKEFLTKKVTLFRRDMMRRIKDIEISTLGKTVEVLFGDIESNMFIKARDKLENHRKRVEAFDDFIHYIGDNMVQVPWCEDINCEKELCQKTKHAKNISIKTLCMPFTEQNTENKKCIYCGKLATKNVLFAKSF